MIDPLISCIYSRPFVRGRFLYIIKLEPESKVLKWKDFISREIYFKDFFTQNFFGAKFRTLFPKTFFRELLYKRIARRRKYSEFYGFFISF